MKDEIEKWKQYNGNVSYSTKELLQGIHIKIDENFKDIKAEIEDTRTEIENIRKSCFICNNNINKNSNDIVWHKRFILGLYGTIGFIVIIILKNASKLNLIF